MAAPQRSSSPGSSSSSSGGDASAATASTSHQAPGAATTTGGPQSSSSPAAAAAAAPASSEAVPVAQGGGEEGQEGSGEPGRCPICVLFEEGGCKEAFDAFMDCGVAAEKGGREYRDCVSLFDAMRECMQRNPAVFAPLLQDVNTAVGQGQAPEGEQGPTQAAAAAAAAADK